MMLIVVELIHKLSVLNNIPIQMVYNNTSKMSNVVPSKNIEVSEINDL